MEDVHRQAFLEEAQELLSELESSLLELEERPEDVELIDRVFRAMHTIKGSGAMFGFDDVAAFTHDLETVFDCARGGKFPISRDLLDLTLASRDHITKLLNEQVDEPLYAQGRTIIARLRELAAAEGEGGVCLDRAAKPPAFAKAAEQSLWRLSFAPHEGFFFAGHDPLIMLADLTALGRTKTVPNLDRLTRLSDLNPEALFLRWDVALETDASNAAIKNVFLFAEKDCELSLAPIEDDPAVDAEYKKLGEILIERGDVDPLAVAQVLAEKPKLGDELVQRGIAQPSSIDAALAEQKLVREAREAKKECREKVESSSIRVAAEKLDSLVDLVGELVIVQAQISQLVSERKDAALTALAEQLERLSDELRDSTLAVRMLPIGATFSKFRRLVRDLSSELGKEIDLETNGAETELDKTVIERLNDPLVHLLRNSIDHGIESPEDRVRAGKSPKGRILLSAEHSGAEVHITIVDDGKGLDVETLRKKAAQRGLIGENVEMSEKDVFNLIFLPGFSTAQKVTNVSGRGVGMDVVKKAIDALRGAIGIDSKKGVGTTITIRLPLTLAIIEGLQVETGGSFFVIPLSLVEECVELAEKADKTGSRRQIINLRDEIVPYIRLRDWFAIEGIRPSIEQIVIVGVDGGRMGVVVDTVIGEHQTVIKSLGRVYRDVEGVSGATIKGDGTLALILDVPKLVGAAVDDWTRLN